MSAVLKEAESCFVAAQEWQAICALDDILPDTGVCAWFAGRQIAVFRVGEGEEVYVTDNFDPHSGANVLSRGLVGDLNGELMVASPIYKHHYSLKSGRCFESPEVCIGVYAARVVKGRVEVKV